MKKVLFRSVIYLRYGYCECWCHCFPQAASSILLVHRLSFHQAEAVIEIEKLAEEDRPDLEAHQEGFPKRPDIRIETNGWSTCPVHSHQHTHTPTPNTPIPNTPIPNTSTPAEKLPVNTHPSILQGLVENDFDIIGLYMVMQLGPISKKPALLATNRVTARITTIYAPWTLVTPAYRIENIVMHRDFYVATSIVHKGMALNRGGTTCNVDGS